MDINKRYMGEDIFVGDMQKEISKIDGVLNLIDTRIYNEYNESKYSKVRTSQATTNQTVNACGEVNAEDEEEGRAQIDLFASDYVLTSDSDCMFEVKYPETDIKVWVKRR